MSKETAPAFQFYAADYLADAKVAMMTIEDEGCYIRLLAYCWREGSIPNDDDKLTLLCKDVTPSELVKGCFKQPSSDETILVHPRLQKERSNQRRWRKKSSKGGKISAAKRKELKKLLMAASGSRVVQPKGNTSSSSSSSKRYSAAGAYIGEATEKEKNETDKQALKAGQRQAASKIRDFI